MTPGGETGSGYPAYGSPPSGQPPYNPQAYSPQPYSPPPYSYPPQQGYGQPGYGQPGYAAQGGGALWWGPPGRIRPTGMSILLFVVTFGIYGYVYNYQVHDEMKRHNGRGIGGGVALVLTLCAGIAMPFVTPNEVGNLYVYRGQRRPVSATTGLWAIVPTLASLVLLIVSIASVFATASYHDSFDSYGNPDRVPTIQGGQIAVLIIAPVLFFLCAVGGQLVAFIKTNRALNGYWESLGVRA